MSLDEKFVPIKTGFYEIVSSFFEKIAQFFGYPENPGMPIPIISYDNSNNSIPYIDNTSTSGELYNELYNGISDELYKRLKFVSSLPTHKSAWPPPSIARTWFEVIFGSPPKPNPVPRYMYENPEEGFYNFYIQNYKNIWFLPDGVSEFIQVRLNICLDISILESMREALFVILFVFSQLLLVRITIAWFLTINPYKFPWSLLIKTVEWADELLVGIIPSVFGLNLIGSLALISIGRAADGLTHLVFTMPFLPSEAEEAKILINKEMKDVLIFHYLPVLWYKHPIPNNIREFWYKEKPHILQYMQAAYKDLEIQLLPDSIIKQLNLNQQSDLVSQSSGMHDYLEYLSTETLFQSNVFVNYINLINDNFHNFVLNHINRLL